MIRRSQSLLAFSLTTLGAAATVVVGLRVSADLLVTAQIPHIDKERIESARFVRDAVGRWTYGGSLFSSKGSKEWFTVSFPDPGAPRISVTVVCGRGRGGATMVGLLEDDGAFKAGPSRGSGGFPLFRSLRGRVKGPALVGRVPAIWFEAEAMPMELAAGRKTSDLTWAGVLRAGGIQD